MNRPRESRAGTVLAGRRMVLAAATSYLAATVLGTAVITRLLDTRRARWVHHLLFAVTLAVTILAVLHGVATGERSARSLRGALVPLAAIPYTGTHTRRHPVVALSASPFYLIAAARVARTSRGG